LLRVKRVQPEENALAEVAAVGVHGPAVSEKKRENVMIYNLIEIYATGDNYNFSTQTLKPLDKIKCYVLINCFVENFFLSISEKVKTSKTRWFLSNVKK
jgi:hypothetical protein